MYLEYKCPGCGKIEMLKKHTHYMRVYKNSHCKDCNLKRLRENNPFKGKTHSKETIELISAKAKNRVLSEEHKDKLRATLRKANFRTPLYEHWCNTQGKEIADQKLAASKKKLSENNSGSKNPMFGKLAPKGSGSGLSGWYNDWYFRSLRELTYVVNVLEPNNTLWVCGEAKKYRISYMFNGNRRNYFPDFIVGSSIIEIKPIKLQITDLNMAKKEAAEKFCLDNNMTYAVIDITPMKKEQFLKLIEDGLVIPTERTKKKL